MNVNNIYHIDVIEGLQQLPKESVQIIIADPPYNIGKDFGNNRMRKKLQDYLVWCDQWIAECLRVLKPNGTMYIYGYSEILAHVATRVDCNYRWLIWHYTNKNVPTLQFWQRSHESILCCWKEERVFNRDTVREPYTDTFIKHAAGRERKATKGRYNSTNDTTTYTAHQDGALPRDVIKVPALAGGAGKKEKVAHPTQKPLELCRKLLAAAKQDQGIIVVPFSGSGSECVAAKELNLEFIGFDINEDYVKLAKERLNAI